MFAQYQRNLQIVGLLSEWKLLQVDRSNHYRVMDRFINSVKGLHSFLMLG